MATRENICSLFTSRIAVHSGLHAFQLESKAVAPGVEPLFQNLKTFEYCADFRCPLCRVIVFHHRVNILHAFIASLALNAFYVSIF